MELPRGISDKKLCKGCLGMPWEHVLLAANEAKKDVWINVPVTAVRIPLLLTLRFIHPDLASLLLTSLRVCASLRLLSVGQPPLPTTQQAIPTSVWTQTRLRRMNTSSLCCSRTAMSLQGIKGLILR